MVVFIRAKEGSFGKFPVCYPDEYVLYHNVKYWEEGFKAWKAGGGLYMEVSDTVTLQLR